MVHRVFEKYLSSKPEVQAIQALPVRVKIVLCCAVNLLHQPSSTITNTNGDNDMLPLDGGIVNDIVHLLEYTNEQMNLLDYGHSFTKGQLIDYLKTLEENGLLEILQGSISSSGLRHYKRHITTATNKIHHFSGNNAALINGQNLLKKKTSKKNLVLDDDGSLNNINNSNENIRKSQFASDTITYILKVTKLDVTNALEKEEIYGKLLKLQTSKE